MGLEGLKADFSNTVMEPENRAIGPIQAKY